jgi:predicted nucleotidyltransferase
MTAQKSIQMSTPPIRLSNQEKTGLLEVFETELTKYGEGQVWLFGSRVDMTAKGGDIDLYIELKVPIEDKFAFTRQLSIAIEKKLGERKIDIVVKAPNIVDSALHQIAKLKGVLLWHKTIH